MADQSQMIKTTNTERFYIKRSQCGYDEYYKGLSYFGSGSKQFQWVSDYLKARSYKDIDLATVDFINVREANIKQGDHSTKILLIKTETTINEEECSPSRSGAVKYLEGQKKNKIYIDCVAKANTIFGPFVGHKFAEVMANDTQLQQMTHALLFSRYGQSLTESDILSDAITSGEIRRVDIYRKSIVMLFSSNIEKISMISLLVGPNSQLINLQELV